MAHDKQCNISLKGPVYILQILSVLLYAAVKWTLLTSHVRTMDGLYHIITQMAAWNPLVLAHLRFLSTELLNDF